MFFRVFWFDLRQRLFGVSIHVYFLVFFAFSFLLMLTAAGAFSGATATTSAGGKVMANSPHSLFGLVATLAYFGLLVIAPIMGQAVYKDFHHKVHGFYYALPLTKLAYLGGRFAAAFAALSYVLFGIILGMIFGAVLPFGDETLVGPHRLLAYLAPYFNAILPNIFIMGAAFFALATLTRKITPVYMASVIVVFGYLIASSFSQDVDSRGLAALVDPFGLIAFNGVTEYWTIVEKNERLFFGSGVFLVNRLIWAGFGVALLALTYARFKFSYAAGLGRRKTRAAGEAEDASGETESLPETATHPVYAFSARFQSFVGLGWLEFKQIVKNVYFAVIALSGVMFVILTQSLSSQVFGTSTYPVTYQVLETVNGGFILFMLIIITFYAGEAAWRERDAHVDQIMDALPTPNWVIYFSKFLGLALTLVFLSLLIGLCGVAIQATYGYFRFELDQYFVQLFGVNLISYLLFAALALFVQTLARSKFMGHFLMVVFYLTTIGLPFVGVTHRLFRYPSAPNPTYSDMNGYGHFIEPFIWFKGYWTLFAVMLLIAGLLFWRRGVETRWRHRWRLAGERFTGPTRAVFLTAAALFLAVGGLIYYNTNVLNEFQSNKAAERELIDYEKKYRQYLAEPQPLITAVNAEVDIYPRRRDLAIRGVYTLSNGGDAPVERVFINTVSTARIVKLELDRSFQIELEDARLDVHIFRFDQPLAPGETAKLHFELDYRTEGFRNGAQGTSVVANGTFFNNFQTMPTIGYLERAELADPRKRKNNGLPEKPRMPDLDDDAHHDRNYLTGSAHWIDFETTVSTSEDQVAIAPGYLQREWTENGRRYFHYKMDQPILNFFSYISARYEVMRDRWRDVDLEIYYHPSHDFNLDRMMQGMKDALAYCSENFSPYQHKQLRIIEFPRYAGFAQSFPNTVPYSEAIGFIAKVDPDDPDDVDFPYYVTAHEVAHQWWAHQVIGANVQGATLLSETLSQYTALMVVKQKYGDTQMRRFLKLELDRYLLGRAVERRSELPLYRNENQQYIHYQKGSVATYALQDVVGEDTVNRALANLIRDWGFKGPPYPTTRDFIAALQAEIPAERHGLIEDLFETITLYDNRVTEATAVENEGGGYTVTFEAVTKKVRATETGAEEETPLDDLIDVAVLGENDEVLFLEKRRLTGESQRFEIQVDKRPLIAGVDPFNKLIDRQSNDNRRRVVLE